jgi:hypothetical protein
VLQSPILVEEAAQIRETNRSFSRSAGRQGSMKPGDNAGLAPGTHAGVNTLNILRHRYMARLVARPAQSGFQFLLMLLPARVFRLRPSVECGAVSFDFFDLSFMEVERESGCGGHWQPVPSTRGVLARSVAAIEEPAQTSQPGDAEREVGTGRTTCRLRCPPWGAERRPS